MKWLLIVPPALLLVTFGIAWHGIALMLAWNWTAPAVFDVPDATFAQAIVVSFLAGAVHMRGTDSIKSEFTKEYSGLLTMVLRPAFIIAMAWVIKQFI